MKQRDVLGALGLIIGGTTSFAFFLWLSLDLIDANRRCIESGFAAFCIGFPLLPVLFAGASAALAIAGVVHLQRARREPASSV